MKKLLAFLLAAVMLLTLCACGGTAGGKDDGDDPKGSTSSKKKTDPKKVATDYVEADIEGDMKGMLSLIAGKAQKYYEDVYFADEDERDDEFEWLEEQCDEEDIDVTIDSFSDYYDANEQYVQVINKDYYGKYELNISVRETIDMDDDVLDAYCELLDDDTCEDYIDGDAISDGKFVVVKVYIDGTEESSASDTVVPVIKYDGSWKVIEDIYTYHEDYEWDEDKYEARSVILAAIDEARGEDVDEDDYDYDEDYDYDYDEYY